MMCQGTTNLYTIRLVHTHTYTDAKPPAISETTAGVSLREFAFAPIHRFTKEAKTEKKETSKTTHSREGTRGLVKVCTPHHTMYHVIHSKSVHMYEMIIVRTPFPFAVVGLAPPPSSSTSLSRQRAARCFSAEMRVRFSFRGPAFGLFDRLSKKSQKREGAGATKQTQQ